MISRDKIFALSASPEEAHTGFERFSAAYLQATKRDFCLKTGQPEEFFKIFGNSLFLVRFITRHPILVDEILQSPFLQKEKSQETFRKKVQIINFTHYADWLIKVRLYKYRELLRITIKDLMGNRDEEVLRELSSLANAILIEVDQKTLKESKKKWGSPTLKSGQECGYQILAMGKLGGMELNFSSDIDLIPITETDQGKTPKLSFHEFFSNHFQWLTQSMQTETAEGFLYRMDWDLRPEGKSGTLVNSLSAMETYYETFGADWQRQAFIKCRPAAGSKKLGDEFIKMIDHFVYRKYLDLESIRQIMTMKEKIEEEIGRKPAKGFNVKLGPGGIREIEFFAQAFQLIYGGRMPELKNSNTLQTLELLRRAQLISSQDDHFLRSNYLFLRKLEHRLQLVDEQQTHLLSFEASQQLKAARRMGYLDENPDKALTQFQERFKEATSGVHQIFESLFAETSPKTFTSEISRREENQKILDQTRIALEDRLAQWPKFEDWLDEIRFFKKDEVKKISALENDPSYPRMEILCRLSLLAEAMSQVTLKMSMIELEKKYGKPTYKTKAGEKGIANLMTIGMGKLGGREINYASDLDCIFIFSQNGKTTGPKEITNSEYFARLIQKFISILSLTTVAGSAYAIDTELRPSGHFGPLVISLESFLDYQRKASQIWEKQALLRARPIAGPPHFARLIKGHIDALLYSEPFPEEIGSEIHRLRTRVEMEIAREDKYTFDYKAGKGGIIDIEFILQFAQLRGCAAYPELRNANTFEGLITLKQLNLIPSDEADLLLEAYTFYRTLESKIHLKKNQTSHRFQKTDPFLNEIAHDLTFKTGNEMLDQYYIYRDNVRRIYSRIFSQ